MLETMLDDPVVTVHVPDCLRRFTFGAEETMVCGLTVGEALASLGREYPGITDALLTADGKLNGSLEIFLGGTNVLELSGLATPVGSEELIAIVPIVSAIPAGRQP